MITSNPQKFALGEVVITTRAFAALDATDLQEALNRHAAGDWGDMCEEDVALNNEALKEGERLLSCFYSNRGEKFWIITILLPSEY